MSTDPELHDSIDRAAETIGPVWPLHSFVTANPLAGFEDRPFHEAIERGRDLFGGRGYPDPAVFRQAWIEGRIDPDAVRAELAAHGYDETPEQSLERISQAESNPPRQVGSGESETGAATARVNHHLAKWLSAFLDQGQAEWPMPDCEAGFYHAFRATARYDRSIPGHDRIGDLPAEPTVAIEQVLDGHSPECWRDIFVSHLAALPGWSGFVKQRIADDGDWQSSYPITMEGYLAVRLVLADLFGAPIAPQAFDERSRGPTDDESASAGTAVPRAECWLAAWEETYRSELVESVSDASPDDGGHDERPDAQLVFCIDTRSEVIRRHIESQGDYETHGYAGFFGVPMRYHGYDSAVSVDACPPIVDAQHVIEDRPVETHDNAREQFDSASTIRETARDVLDGVKSNAATAFSFVEGTGLGYGVALAARTLVPARVYDAIERADTRVPDEHAFCEPATDPESAGDGELPGGLTLDQKVEYAASAFELMGWETFARVVVFAGHAGQTANNPFDSSLDCGACAGNPGGPNARVLASLCNDERVQQRLRERGFDIPEDTLFLAGEHNTTTDEVALFTGGLPESHREDVERLRADLAAARERATAERVESMQGHASGTRETERRAADWAETRPEWGLAGNAAFVVGPRELTADLNLDGRSFLHSYDWQTDPDGSALEAIMAGPMVVTQWINSQYYFATTDPAVYGSGSKVTHNPVGNVGVYQGNGGDLATGLPVQSVRATDEDPYHLPLRLSVVIHAPVDRVADILSDHDHLVALLDNGWLSLTVVDPQQDHTPYEYDGDLEWTPTRTTPRATPSPGS